MIQAIQLRTLTTALAVAALLGCASAGSSPEEETADASLESPVERQTVVASEASASSDEALEDPYEALFDEEFDFGDDPAAKDPFERTNRALLTFNRQLSRLVFDPMIRGYRFLFPESARRGIHRAFVNFKAPSTLVNDLLQLRFKDAATTLGRFILNTTVGYAGIFDVAIEAGWEHHESDFGQTLGRMGVGSGPFLMLPIFGPSTVRDGFGGVVDLFFQPLTYLIGPTQNIVIGVTGGFTTLDARDAAIKALEESSVDYYAALRSAYLQQRAAHIRLDDR